MNAQEVLLRFEPLDSLFFRDGQPYTKNESEQVGVTSQFPPSPATLIGALRAAVARSLGWAGHGTWSDDIRQVLGDGESLGPLRFRGPLLVHGDDMLFPAPTHLMTCKSPAESCVPAPAHLRTRESDPQPALLHPGPARDCDLGSAIRLPVLPNPVSGEGWKQARTTWLSGHALEAVLRGEPPSLAELVAQDDLWVREARVGIARNEQTRTTDEGALYSPQHVRLQTAVGLGLWTSGLPRDALDRLVQTSHPLGGESRSAWITQVQNEPVWPAMPQTLHRHGDELHYSVIVLSPLSLAEPPLPNQSVPGLPGSLVSACLPRPLMLGGWDSLKRQPLALKPHLALGSVLFMRAKVTDEAAVRALHGTCIGARPAWGYGLVAIGTWN
jgi:CRISPR-associated protein Cmr3